MPRPRGSTTSLSSRINSLLSRRSHLSAQEIVNGLADQGYEYNKTSVYRALEKMVAANQVCRVTVDDGVTNEVKAMYELRNHHHAHLVCEVCGEVSTADCIFDQPEKVGEFEVSHHHLTILGTCQVCSKKGSHAG